MNILANQTLKDARRSEAAAPAEPHLQVERPQPELLAAPADGGAEEAARALAHARHLLLLHLPRVRSQFGGSLEQFRPRLCRSKPI